MLQISATWLKDTDLLGRSRSAELKLLDTSIATYRTAQTWPNLVNVAKALTAWETASATSQRLQKPSVTALKTSLDVVRKIIKVSPTFPWTSATMQAMLNALDQPAGPQRTLTLQTALDGITPTDAENHRQGLKVVVDANPTVCYIGVKTFTASSTPSTTHHSLATNPVPSSRRIRYDSAAFTAQTQLYIIPPAQATHELGFIQHCTAKSDRAAYTDGSEMEDACTATFPVGDAPDDPSQQPWYCKGVGNHCAQPAWMKLTTPARTVDLEMNDSFDNNFHTYHPKPTAAAAYVATATLTSITRTQSFISYLVHKKSDGTFRPLRKVVYTINVAVAVDAQGVVTSFTTSAQPSAPTTPAANEALPTVSAPSMNNLSEWRYKRPSNTSWSTAWVATSL